MYVGSNAPGTEKGYNSMHQASNVGSYLRPQTSSFPTDKEQNELLCGRGGSSVRSEIRRAGCCEFWCGGTYCGVVCCGVVPEKQRDPLLTIEPLVELTIEAELTGAHLIVTSVILRCPTLPFSPPVSTIASVDLTSNGQFLSL